MTNYKKTWLNIKNEEITAISVEAYDSGVVLLEVREWNKTSQQWELKDADNVTALLESYDEGFNAVSTAKVFHEATGLYKIIFEANCLPGIYYLKANISIDGYNDVSRLKVRVKIDT